ncbi:MAG: Mth938-like domain-containing protein [Candidatus Magasanikbacteria bacterium]
MKSDNPPKIKDLSWGKVKTPEGSYKDAKLWPGGSREWDWSETGTHHTPGIQKEDVKELVGKGAEVIVLSKGQQNRLKVKDETIEYLKNNSIDFCILGTDEAVDKYNELAEEEKPVGALIHSTC